MKQTAFVLIGILTPLVLVADQDQERESVAALIKKLGSPTFSTREQATKALCKRPEAEVALRQVLMSGTDLESHRRIVSILERLQQLRDRALLREFEEFAKNGRIDEVIKRVADWPAGKLDDEVWSVMRNLASTLVRLHDEKAGKGPEHYDRNQDLPAKTPDIVKQMKVTDWTEGKDDRHYFIRVHQLELGRSMRYYRREPANFFTKFSFPVVSGEAHYLGEVPPFTFAGKDVHIIDNPRFSGEVGGAFIVSGGDVSIGKCAVRRCVIIARGKVTIRNPANEDFVGNHIIAGGAVTTGKPAMQYPEFPNILRENDPNPLGFVRWSDAPKGEKKKAAP